MPNNRVIYWGIVVLVATVLLWIGAELTKRVEWLLPYTGGLAVAMIVGGFIYEFWKKRAQPPAESGPATTAPTSGEPDKPEP